MTYRKVGKAPPSEPRWGKMTPLAKQVFDNECKRYKERRQDLPKYGNKGKPGNEAWQLLGGASNAISRND
jgi:hypothetical protein